MTNPERPMTRSHIRSNARSNLSFGGDTNTPTGRASRLRRMAGRVGLRVGERAKFAQQIEQLEARVMLAGDHASFSQFPNVNSGDTIVLNATTGLGSRPGIIEALGAGITEQNDLFRFTAVQNLNKPTGATDLVTIRASTLAFGNVLNSRVEVYTLGVANTAVFVAGSSGDGILTSGTPTDGWVGLIATPGVTYYVVVKTDVASGAGSSGQYTLLIDGITEVSAPNAGTGVVNPAVRNLTQLGEDVVYSITTPSGVSFNSLATAIAKASSNPPLATDFDPRLDIFDSAGTLLTFDDDSGRLNDSFSTFRGAASSTYYIRVRSDRLQAGNGATGPFQLFADFAASVITVDPVTRRGAASGTAGNEATTLFSFQAQGTGLAIITALSGNPPVNNALRLFNVEGGFLAFNDNLVTLNAQIEITLEGGRTYYGVVQAFGDSAPGPISVFVDANHTFNSTNSAGPLDDYASGSDFGNATPLTWGAPRNMPNWLATTDINSTNQLTDRNKVVISQISGRIHDTGDSDLFSIIAPVDMLADFAGKPDPASPFGQWRVDHRPGTRLQVLLRANDGFIFTPTVEIVDSQGNLLGSNSGVFAGNPAGFPMGASAGFWDPASFPQTMTIPLNGWQPVGGAEGPKVWGGETYFIRVSGSVKGRYTLTVFADTMVPLVAPENNVRTDNKSVTIDQLDGPAIFTGLATGLGIGSTTGDARYGGGFSGTFSRSGGFERGYQIGTGSLNGLAPGFNPLAAGTGMVRLEESTLGGIESYTDSDLFSFIAPFSGTFEVRVNTTQLNDSFNEFVADGEEAQPPTVTINASQTKVYDSPLDSALRIFDNDFQQIGYNNDNSAIEGEQGVASVGSLGNRQYHRRDARLVLNIEAGNTYFIQVEQGQLANLTARASDSTQPVDWARALGSYELLIHSMPNLNFVDDHSNSFQLATVFPINSDPTQANNTASAFLTGRVETNTDTDLFTFIAPARGTFNVTLTRPSGSLLGIVNILDGQQQVVRSGAAATDGSLSLTGLTMVPGDRFYVQVFGSGGTTGDYRIAVSNVGTSDDFADFGQSVRSTLIPQFDFLGSGTVSGRIEQPGDTDIFRFTAFDFQTMAINVTSSSSTLNPTVTVYEGGLDGGSPAALANPNSNLLRIGFNDDISVSDRNAQVSFPVSPNRTSAGRTFRYYYVVVSGSDRNVDYGNYQVTVTFPATDDHPDAGEFTFADTIAVDTATGAGTATGRTESLADTDLFKFTAPAGGEAGVVVTRPTGSTAIPRVTIIDLSTGSAVVIATGTASENGVNFNPADTGIFQVGRSSVYYVLVENTGGRFGQYTVSVGAPAVDDYPNIGEFSLAYEIPLVTSTGDGTLGSGVVGDLTNPRLQPSNDTDLFKFRPIDDGPVAILVSSFSGSVGRFAPRIRIFDVSGNLLPGGDVSATGIPSTNNPSQVTFTFTNGLQGVTYFILVSAVNGLAPPATLTGEYRVFVDTFSTTGGDGSDPGEINFSSPSALNLSPRTGDGFATDLINAPGDRDLFTFTLPAGANGQAFVQVVTPGGSILDAAVTILNAPSELSVVTSDSAGIPGATANARFTSVGGQQYWVIVTGLGAGVGAYTLRVNTQPALQYLYYPEGYASPAIREFVSISNNNSTAVTYSILAYYEDGSAPTVLVNQAVIGAGSRSGITTSDAANGTFNGLKQFTPYSLVIQSTGPLGATLAHYDFSSTVGDSFSETLSPEWTFARVERNPGAVSDFIVYYNPNTFAVQVTFTAYTATGAFTSVVQTVPGLQRFGLSINDVSNLPNGIFGMRLTAVPVNSADASNFLGITAALSHYDAANRGGFGFIGDSEGGSTTGAIASLTNGDSVTGEVVILNATSAAAIVNLSGKYLTTGLPDLIRTLTIPAFGQLVLRGTDLNLVRNQTVGLRFDSNVPVSITASQRQNGEADATSTAVEGATSFFFGDGFVNTALAGSFYFETLAFYNPTGQATTATIRLLFTGVNDFITVSVPIAARGFAQLKLHELPQLIVDRPGLNFYSIQVDSIVPIAATLTHYDLFLGGGWTTNGVPLGLTNSFGSIV